MIDKVRILNGDSLLRSAIIIVLAMGLGSTANAMANMETLSNKYSRKAHRAFFAFPLVGPCL